jgi:hypothetical protein
VNPGENLNRLHNQPMRASSRELHQGGSAQSLTASSASLLDEQIGHTWSSLVAWRISFS